MTVGDSEKLRSVARKIADASAPDVLADIEAVRKSQKKPAWLAPATAALEVRYGTQRPIGTAQPASEGVAFGGAPVGNDETIVFAVGTPVFAVKENAVDISGARPEAKAWRELLTTNANTVNRLLRSVGRVDVDNFDGEYVGTAWVIDDGLVVTNRHVANYFSEASGVGFKFKLGFDARNPIGVKVDFLEEFDNTASDEIAVERVVWVAPDGGPDVAFLKLEDRASAVGRVKLELADEQPRVKLPVAVVGYPARDSRFSDRDLAEKIFGGRFDKKRVAVGNLLGADDAMITHSCSTLGGNSGSPVIDIGTGRVVGLHYRGIEFIENDAVPAGVLRRCLVRARGLLETTGTANMSDTTSGGGGNATITGRGGMSFTVPLKITVEIDGAALQGTFVPTTQGGVAPAPAVMGASARPRPEPPSTPPPAAEVDRERVREAVRMARAELANREDVVAVKEGYRFENGVITDQRAVVIAVKRKVEKGALEARGVVALPSYVHGVRTDVTVATTADLLGTTMAEEAVPNWHTSYEPRPDLPLKRRKAKMGFVIHSGPDAGWPHLEPFLKATKSSLAIAMYEFGAPHVVDGVIDAVKSANERIAMVLQLGGNISGTVKKDDLTDEETVAAIRDKKKSKFTFAPASVGKTGIFDSAYHIKVAVRDKKALWLSSGSWQSSNQPNVAPLTDPPGGPSALRLYNREWHVILEDAALSELFEAHIQRDLVDASAQQEGVGVEEPLVFVPANMPSELDEAPQKPRYFEPLVGNRQIDVQPILTPDNYIEKVLPFIESAKNTIDFQNQSFNCKTVGPEYKKLLDALLQKQRDGLDVKIIFRSFGPDDRDTLTAAKDYGFDMNFIRAQKNCHTKGIIIDNEAVLVGSHNWTTAGTKFNRDASLIFYDRDIAQFYKALFQYDWARIGPAKVDESLPGPIIVTPGNETTPPPGYVAVPLSTVLGR